MLCSRTHKTHAHTHTHHPIVGTSTQSRQEEVCGQSDMRRLVLIMSSKPTTLLKVNFALRGLVGRPAMLSPALCWLPIPHFAGSCGFVFGLQSLLLFYFSHLTCDEHTNLISLISLSLEFHLREHTLNIQWEIKRYNNRMTSCE